MTPYELQAEIERLREQVERKQRYIDGCRQLIGAQGSLETAIEELIQKSVDIQVNAECLRRPTCDICCGEPLPFGRICACGGSGRAEDALNHVRVELEKMTKERDEACAQSARLTIAILGYRNWFDTVTKIAPGWEDKAAQALDNLDAALLTDSRAWLNGRIAEELERLVETFREAAWRAADGAKGETGMSMAFNEASHLIRERAAELRRESE